MQKYEHEVLIYVWRFVGMRVGHASLKLKSPTLSNPAAGGKNHCYISWWPKDDPTGEESRFGWRDGSANRSYQEDRRNELKPRTREALAKGTFSPRSGQKYASPVYAPPTQGQGAKGDPSGWGQSADEKIYLPGIGSDGIVFGLDISAMVQWWHLFNNTGESDRFSITKLNCSRVVAMCLLAGGAGRVCKPPSRSLNIWTPNTIETWAKKIERVLAERNKAMADINVTSLPKSDQPVSDLLDPDTWKRATKPGAMSIRRAQVVKIDKVLEKFSRIRGVRDEESLDQSLELLKAVLAEVHSHICEKGDVSKNREAVARLGKQTLREFRERSQMLAGIKRQQAEKLRGGSKYELLDKVNKLTFDGDKLGLESWSI